MYNEHIKNTANPERKDIERALEMALDYNNSLKSFLSEMYQVFENSLENVPNFSASVIEGHKTKISTYGQQIEQALLSSSGNMFVGVQAIIQGFQDIQDEQEKTLALLDKKIALSQASLEATRKNVNISPETQKSEINRNKTSIEMIEEKIHQAQAALKNLEASKQARLDEIDSQITQSSVQNSLQQLAAGKGTIVAPLSGIVTKKMIEIGSVVGPGQTLVEISDDASKKVSIEVSEEILQKIKKDDNVHLMFE